MSLWKIHNKKLKNDGGQNPIEPAKLGYQIYHGPYVYNFKKLQNLKRKQYRKEINGVNDFVVELKSDFKKMNKKIQKSFRIIHNLEKRFY